MGYVEAAANLYGLIYRIEGTRDWAAIRNILENVQVPSFTPKSSVKIHLTDEEMDEEKEKERDDAGELFELADILCYYVTFLQDFFSLLSVSLHQKKPNLRS